MKKILLLSSVFLLLLSATSLVYAQEFSYKDYCLVWSDEFNGSGLPNEDYWSYETGYVRNNEDQYYTEAREENIRMEGGNLIIEAREDNWTGPDGETHQYTSASIASWGKVTHQYGKFEVRAKIDTRDGSWPAFWILGESGEWPSNGEVDIMEYYQDKILANVAWGTDEQWTAEWDSESRDLSEFPDGWEDEFHTWTMEWTSEEIRLYVDDILMNTTDLDQTTNGSISDIDNPFHQGHHILLNQAIGGDNGGDPSNTDFPIRYVIDYVRVYQQGDCDNLDCNWDENGNAYIDSCGRCVGGNTAKEPCDPDCGNGNLIDNPGFESGDLTAWEGWGTRNTTSAEAYSGTYGVDVEANGAAEMVVDVQPNTRYILRARARKGGNSGWYRLGAKEHGTAESYTEFTNTTWTEAEHTFTTGDATSALIYFYNGSSGNAYGDDFYLVPAGCDTTINIDCNGDENGNAYLDECDRCVGGNTGREPCDPACNGNLIDNPGFESGDLSSWTGWGSRSVSSGEAFSGSYSVNVEANGAAEMIVDVEPNTNYTLKARARKEESGWVRLGVKEHGTAETYQEITNTSWTEVEHSFTTGNSDTARIYFYNGSSGSAYGDDFYLEQTGCDSVITGKPPHTNSKPAISLYPNPSSGAFNLSVPEAGMVKIYNATGQLIDQIAVEQTLRYGESLRPGIYSIQYTSDSGVETFKWVKK